MKHADFTNLFEIAAGTLPAAEAGRITAHIEVCARCSAEADAARTLFSTVRADRTAAPPEAAVRRAIQLWKQEHPGLVKRASRVIRAVLSFDSLAMPAPAGVRSTRPASRSASGRRMLYTAGDYDIDLAIEHAAARRGRVSLRGQVLSRSSAPLPSGLSATLQRVPGRAAAVELTEHGAFEVESLAPGRYRFSVSTGRERIVVDRLDLN